MAKVSGPLMSMEASGAFGGTLVFGKWKGRNTVRQLVTPSNPKTQGQEDARNRTRITGAIQNWVNMTTQKQGSNTKTDKELIQAATPSGQAWNGFLTKSIIGKGGLSFTAAETAYNALTTLQKTAWNTAAAGLTPAIATVNQTTAGGASTTPASAGQVFFHLVYGMSLIGIGTTPTGTPPTYA